MSDDFIRFPVVGLPYGDYPTLRASGGGPSKGAVVDLVPEPQNPYDDTAVAVYWGSYRLGYVPAKGTTCGRCLSPQLTDTAYPVCRVCGADSSEFVPKGLAFRLTKSGWINQPTVIENISEKSIELSLLRPLCEKEQWTPEEN